MPPGSVAVWVIATIGLLIVGLIQGRGMSEALHMARAALVIPSLEGWHSRRR